MPTLISDHDKEQWEIATADNPKRYPGRVENDFTYYSHLIKFCIHGLQYGYHESEVTSLREYINALPKWFPGEEEKTVAKMQERLRGNLESQIKTLETPYTKPFVSGGDLRSRFRND